MTNLLRCCLMLFFVGVSFSMFYLEDDSQMLQTPLNVLCLSGGGMRAKVTIGVLKVLEERARKPIRSLFDMCVGTSTGGILCSCLFIFNKTLSECEDLYDRLGQAVFSSSSFPGSQYLNLFSVGTFYDTHILESFINSTIESHFNLSNITLDDPRVATDKKVILVAATGAVNVPIPYLFRNYNPYGFGQVGTHTGYLFHALRATSAASAYFDPLVTPQGEVLIDAGLGYNNPTKIAYFEIHQTKLGTIQTLVSVGTGDIVWKNSDPTLVNLFEKIVAYVSSHTIIHNDMDNLVHQVHFKNYFHFNPPIPNTDLATVDLTTLANLKLQSEAWIKTPEKQDKITQLLTARESFDEPKCSPRDTYPESIVSQVQRSTSIFPIQIVDIVGNNPALLPSGLEDLTNSLVGDIYTLGSVGKFQGGKSTLLNWIARYAGYSGTLFPTGLGHERQTRGIWVLPLPLTNKNATLLLFDTEGSGAGNDSVISSMQNFVGLISGTLVINIPHHIDNGDLAQMKVLGILSNLTEGDQKHLTLYIPRFQGKFTVNGKQVTPEVFLETKLHESGLVQLYTHSRRIEFTPVIRNPEIMRSFSWEKLCNHDRVFHQQFAHLVAGIFNKAVNPLHEQHPASYFLSYIDDIFSLVQRNNYGEYTRWWDRFYTAKAVNEANTGVQLYKNSFQECFPQITGDDAEPKRCHQNALKQWNSTSALLKANIPLSWKHEATSIFEQATFKLLDEILKQSVELRAIKSEAVRQYHDSVHKQVTHLDGDKIKLKIALANSKQLIANYLKGSHQYLIQSFKLENMVAELEAEYLQKNERAAAEIKRQKDTYNKQRTESAYSCVNKDTMPENLPRGRTENLGISHHEVCSTATIGPISRDLKPWIDITKAQYYQLSVNTHPFSVVSWIVDVNGKDVSRNHEEGSPKYWGYKFVYLSNTHHLSLEMYTFGWGKRRGCVEIVDTSITPLLYNAQCFPKNLELEWNEQMINWNDVNKAINVD